jgi:hypothetical protein
MDKGMLHDITEHGGQHIIIQSFEAIPGASEGRTTCAARANCVVASNSTGTSWSPPKASVLRSWHQLIYLKAVAENAPALKHADSIQPMIQLSYVICNNHKSGQDGDLRSH